MQKFRTIKLLEIIKKNIQNLLDNKLREGKVYYKEELYSSSRISYPSVVMSLNLKSFAITNLEASLFASSPDIEIMILTLPGEPYKGLSLAFSIIFEIEKNEGTQILKFSIDDTRVLESDSEKKIMTTILHLTLRKEIKEEINE